MQIPKASYALTRVQATKVFGLGKGKGFQSLQTTISQTLKSAAISRVTCPTPHQPAAGDCRVVAGSILASDRDIGQCWWLPTVPEALGNRHGSSYLSCFTRQFKCISTVGKNFKHFPGGPVKWGYMQLLVIDLRFEDSADSDYYISQPSLTTHSTHPFSTAPRKPHPNPVTCSRRVLVAGAGALRHGSSQHRQVFPRLDPTRA